jgi:glycosyltransferase involved in cell wall biosynthesis
MPGGPFISVVIPTRDRLGLLRQTVDCLMQQTYPSSQFEILVVDDGSTDGTADYLRQLEAQGRLRHVRQVHKGPGAARNAGALVARGQVIAFTDHDCLPEPDWLAALAASYAPDDGALPAAVGGPIRNVSEGHWLHPFYGVRGCHGENDLEAPMFLDSANASFFRPVFLAVGGFHEFFDFPAAEDTDLGLRLTAAGYGLRTISQGVVWHLGRTSLREWMKQRFDRGRGDAMLMLKYPDQFVKPSGRGLSGKVRRLLDSLLHLASLAPQPARPLACAIAAALRCVGFAVPQTQDFVRIRLPRQTESIRALSLGPARTTLCWCLLWCDHWLQLCGQIAGSFDYTRHQVRAGHRGV